MKTNFHAIFYRKALDHHISTATSAQSSVSPNWSATDALILKSKLTC